MPTIKFIRANLLLISIFFLSQSLLGQSISILVENEMGEPIPGALISSNNKMLEGLTDGEGNLIFNDVTLGPYLFTVECLGYLTATRNVQKASENLNLTFRLKEKPLLDEPLLIEANRVGTDDPLTTSNFGKKDLEESNRGMDFPFLFENSPSVTLSSDAGTGIGYTGIRIRGTDPTRVNVSINGIPLNDSEGHGVFWVNLPDFASSAENVQIQRGLGSSNFGTGAFGGNVVINTLNTRNEPKAEIHSMLGSYNSKKVAVMASTGNLNGFSFNARLSSIQSDGYIDRASADLQSWYASGQYRGKKSSLSLLGFGGKERTYQAWYGVPQDSIEDEEGRRYNFYTYENEVDNYGQNHYQAHFSQQLSRDWLLKLSAHYTQGAGYFEQEKLAEPLSEYGLEDVIHGADTIKESDIIRRRWLDNDFYGAGVQVHYYSSDGKWNAQSGFSGSNYEGDHFGEVIWASQASNALKGHRYYENDAIKTEWTGFLKLQHRFREAILLYSDLQFRHLDYTIRGFDDLQFGEAGKAHYQHQFFNPSIGLSYSLSAHQKAYIAYGLVHKEPNRDDYTESPQNQLPKPEQLKDLELGYRYQKSSKAFGINLFIMDYKNQLVLNGEVNDVGAYSRINITKSYRRGIEVDLQWQANRRLKLNANLTLSQNKIPQFTQFFDWWCDTCSQYKENFTNTDLSFSPNVVTNLVGEAILFQKMLDYESSKNFKWHGLSASWKAKFVAKQFLDNTSSDSRSLDSYFVNHLGFSYTTKGILLPLINLDLKIRNIFSELYESNGWTYSYYDGTEIQQVNGYYPQSTAYFLLNLRMRFFK